MFAAMVFVDEQMPLRPLVWAAAITAVTVVIAAPLFWWAGRQKKKPLSN
jgi:hypothetical protein